MIDSYETEALNRVMENRQVFSSMYPYRESANQAPIPTRPSEKDRSYFDYSVIIPAYNEANTIGPLIHETQRILTTMDGTSEIIVVDDGSKDATYDIAKKYRVSIIKNESNAGKGAALRKGFAIAKGDIIVTMDADGSHSPKEIPLMIEPIVLNGADAVIGVRKHLTYKPSLSRRFGNILFNVLTYLFLRAKFADTQCGFRAFKRSTLMAMEIKSNGFDVESEVLIKLVKDGVNIIEKDVSCVERAYGSSRIQWIRDGLRIFYRILHCALE